MKFPTDPSRRAGLIGLGLIGLASGLPMGLSGCTQIVPGQTPPPDLFRLTPKSTFPADLTPVDWQLLVDTPVAFAGLNSPRIALMRSLTKLEYYARTNWTDRAPAMVQSLIVESFENSGAIISVGRQTVVLRADYLLQTELREFQAEYFEGALPFAHVSINAKLVEMPQRRIVASQEFSARVQSEADRMNAIVLAFDEALGDVLKDLVVWTLRSGRRSA